MISFDINKLKYHNQHAQHYNVRFKPWHVNEQFTTEKLSVMKKLGSCACYSRLFDKYNGNTDATINGICTVLFVLPTADVRPIEEDVGRWITLGVKHKMLPEHLTQEYCVTPYPNEKNKFYVMAAIKCEGIAQATMYMYLNVFRELYEDPGFVKAVLYLHDELGIDFYAAYVISSFFNKVGSGHHILPITRSMSVYKTESSSGIRVLNSIIEGSSGAELDLNIVRALYKFVNDDSVDRGYPIIREAKLGSSRAAGWCCIEKIMALSRLETKDGFKLHIPIHQLDHPKVDELISAPIEDAVNILTEITKMEVVK